MPATGQVTFSPATFHAATQRALHPAVRTRPRRSSSVTAHIRARSSRAQESDASAADALTGNPAAGPSAPAALAAARPDSPAGLPPPQDANKNWEVDRHAS